MERLLAANGPELFDLNQVLPIDEHTRNGHLEFVIRYFSRHELPESSRNKSMCDRVTEAPILSWRE
jgi:hypothetical protein